jgi:hypothetical protein
MQIARMETFVERNLDLTRKLLKAIEKEPRYNGQKWYKPDAERDSLGVIGRGDYSLEDVSYNLNLLIEGGFVIGKIERDETMPLIKRLTSKGHDFIDTITPDGIWEQTKQEAKKIPGATLDAIAKIALDIVMKQIGLS